MQTLNGAKAAFKIKKGNCNLTQFGVKSFNNGLLRDVQAWCSSERNEHGLLILRKGLISSRL